MEWHKKLFEGVLAGVAKIRLTGGAVGKVSYVLIACCLAVAAISFSPNTAVAICSLAAIVFTVNFLGYKMIGFAEKNPQAAQMEGVELLGYHHLLAQKNRPQIDVLPGEFGKNPAIDIDANRPLFSPEDEDRPGNMNA